MTLFLPSPTDMLLSNILYKALYSANFGRVLYIQHRRDFNEKPLRYHFVEGHIRLSLEGT